MALIETTVDNITVLMEAYERDNYGFSDTDNSEPSTKIIELFNDAACLIEGISSRFSQKINEHNPGSPDEVKLGFSIGASTESNVWVLKAKGELTIDVEMTWKREK